jgi:hypothetical protein
MVTSQCLALSREDFRKTSTDEIRNIATAVVRVFLPDEKFQIRLHSRILTSSSRLSEEIN